MNHRLPPVDPSTSSFISLSEHAACSSTTFKCVRKGFKKPEAIFSVLPFPDTNSSHLQNVIFTSRNYTKLNPKPHLEGEFHLDRLGESSNTAQSRDVSEFIFSIRKAASLSVHQQHHSTIRKPETLEPYNTANTRSLQQNPLLYQSDSKGETIKQQKSPT